MVAYGSPPVLTMHLLLPERAATFASLIGPKDPLPAPLTAEITLGGPSSLAPSLEICEPST